MHLSDYMALKKLSDEQVGRDLGVTRETATRYRNRAITPPPARIAQIEKWSDGAVRLEDWIASEAAE
jgi:hypothetical protein